MWIGLISGLIASVSGLSGSMYVWQPEISAALNSRILKVDEQTYPESTLHQTAYSLYKSYRDSIVYLNLPYREQQTIQLILKDGTSLYFHPLTKELLGEKSLSIRFFEGLLKFHRTMFIPRYGKYLMGGSTALFFTLLLTSGLYLWWRRYKPNLKRGLSISLKKSSRFFHYDMHKILGIVFFIPLLAVAVSGSYFTFSPAYKSVFRLIDIPRKVKASNNYYRPQYMDPEELLRKPTEDDYKLRAVYFPRDSISSFRFRYIREREIASGLRKSKEIVIDQNHQVSFLSDYHKNSGSEKVLAQMYPIHIGEIFGIFGRILFFIIGLVPAILLLTGYKFYKYKARKKKQS